MIPMHPATAVRHPWRLTPRLARRVELGQQRLAGMDHEAYPGREPF
jgi:hypothetical protein